MKPLLIILFAGALMAQTRPAPPTPAIVRLYDDPLTSVEQEVVGLAEAMPADKYDFAPKDGAFDKVRTFGEQARHIATVIYMCSAAILKQTPPVDPGPTEDGPAANRTKDQVLKYLRDAFAAGHKAMQSITTENQLEMIPSPFGKGEMSRGAAAAVPVWHSFDHYGQMVVYARMNRVVPPASQPQQPQPPAAKK